MSIFGMEFKSNIGKFFAWLIVLSILTGLSMAFYQFMLDPSTKGIFDSFIGSLSPTMQSVFNLDPEIDYTDLTQYIGFIFQFIAGLVAIFAMQLGARSLAKEQGTGDIEYIYANPVSRDEIYWQKFLANFILFFLFCLCFAAITFGLSLILQPTTLRKADLLLGVLKTFLSVFVIGLVYLGLGMLLSSLFNSQQADEGACVLIVLLSALIIILLKMFVGLEAAGYFILEGFKGISVVQGSFSLISLVAGGLVFVLGLVFGYLIYNAKELKY
ncbi:ABC-type transport system involved in multi-copper enzyme maturation, permease component [Urinicoccus massiliensis]|uniref:ABC-type transport system involved in multi-copper enzyme maturation, permease component n=1 Tax=Urinicoccus massiliensis TaxID=1723382 RepID=A0A8H2M4U1_9FIRM|nr:ABC transporter permease subunit [Urinicoccus massiliensis]VFB16444.1 ABC-type transport system involved in multi-copper enzyme maturation, permease component [Urinicoccus massiliensis]